MRRRAVWLALIVLATAGCSAITVPGMPAEKVLTKAELYDPCTLPAASLQAAGLDPKIIGADFFGVPDPKWHLCVWRAPSFYLTVLSTTNTFSEVRDNPKNEETRAVIVAGRHAITYFDASDPSRFQCDIAFATAVGVVIVRSDVEEWQADKQHACDVARASVMTLNKDFPR